MSGNLFIVETIHHPFLAHELDALVGKPTADAGLPVEHHGIVLIPAATVRVKDSFLVFREHEVVAALITGEVEAAATLDVLGRPAASRAAGENRQRACSRLPYI